MNGSKDTAMVRETWMERYFGRVVFGYVVLFFVSEFGGIFWFPLFYVFFVLLVIALIAIVAAALMALNGGPSGRSH